MRTLLSLGWAVVLLACSSEDSDSATSNAQSGAGAQGATGGQGGAGNAGGAGASGGSENGGGGQGGAPSVGGAGGGGGQSSDTFACGPMMVMCQHGLEYCDIYFPGVPDADPTYTCTPLPRGCQPDPACECIPGTGEECNCEESPAGDLTFTCLGI